MNEVSRRSMLAGLAAPLLGRRADAQVTPEIVRFRPEIEPLVSLIERTPREKCAEMAVEQFRRGVSYRQMMAAQFLAGIRNVNPRPPGFALHCVFVTHSAHLMSLEAPADARLLPLFYTLDNFKAAQERDARQPAGDYAMRPMAGTLPPAERAAAELTAALEAWDGERAERAAAAVARHLGPSEALSQLWRYGARDYRNIGHKAIYVANAARTLEAIGWQHAEPVLRSLVLALVDFGREQKVNGYAFEDQCYTANARRVRESFAKLADGWAGEAGSPAATLELLETMRRATPEEASREIFERLTKGAANAGSVWDAAHLAAAELRMRARGGAAIVGLHAPTSANALHHGWQAVGDPRLRCLLLLQAAGWMSQFRVFAAAREENLRPFSITELEPADAGGGPDRLLAEIFENLRANPDAAAARAFRMSQDRASRAQFVAAALRHTIAKADEVHYYKYLAALIEDTPLVHPDLQPRLAAAIVYYMKGQADPETAAMKRAREALRSLPA